MRKLLMAVALTLASGAVLAQNHGFYLGAGVSQAKIDDIGRDFDVDSLNDFKIDDTAWKIIAGFRPFDFLAVEANYMDLGSESRTIAGVGVSAEAKAIAGYVVGFLPLPLPLIDLYAKAGLARWETEGRALDFDIDDDGTEFAYGVGAQVRLGSLAARLEYEQFDIDNSDGLELLTLGLTWTFL